MVREYHGATREFEGNAATDWGNFAEPLAIADHELLYGPLFRKGGFVIHPEHDWLGATPDGWITESTLLEIKCPFSKKDIKDPEEFKPLSEQPHYYAQIQIQLYVTGCNKCMFMQWCQKTCIYESVYFDKEWIDKNLPILKAFYDRYLNELTNKDHLEDEVQIIESHSAADDYTKALEQFKKAEENLDIAKTRLIQAAKGKKSKIGGYLIFKNQRKGSISYAKAIKKYCPDADLEEFRGKPLEYWSIK